MPPSQVPVFQAPLHGRRLTPGQWNQIERHLEAWKKEVLQAAAKHPARSYKLGRAQIEAFADLLGGLQTAAPIQSAFGGISPSMQAAEAWSKTYTLHELNDALNVYVGKIKDALLYGLRGGLNPVDVAQMMYRATKDATINWRTIARTEMARANAVGRLDACEGMGYDKVWVPPHVGACKSCKRLLEGKVFTIAELRAASNYGRPQGEWVACCPLHPQCRHSYLPYDPEVYAEAMAQYARMEAAGLTDEDRLDELFDSSGQLKPGVDPSLFDAAKSMDFYAEGLAVAVAKVRASRSSYAIHKTSDVRRLIDVDELRTDLYQREPDPDKVLSMHAALRRGEDLPPPRVSTRADGTHFVYDGQHRVIARKLHGERRVLCDVTSGMSWQQEHDACRAAIAKVWSPRAAIAITYGDGMEIFDGGDEPLEKATHTDELLAAVAEYSTPIGPDEAPEPEPLNPLLFDGLRLRDDVALALEGWWARVAGEHWTAFSSLYVPAHGDHVHVRVDYDAMRAARPELKRLADTDLHLALVAATRRAGGDVKELAPGLPMQLQIDPVHAEDLAAWTEGLTSSWTLGKSTWLGPMPAGVEKTIDVDWSDGATDYAVAPRLLDSDEFEAIAKAAKPAASPNSGVEHWITIHPHGDEEKGTPVLVRNNADGSMSVIGGAGGNLNHLRLDPGRRVGRDEKTGKPKGAINGASRVDQPVSDEEAERSRLEREQEIAGARDALAKVTEKKQQTQAELHAFIGKELGIDLDDPDLDSKAKRKMLQKIRTSALRTLAYGELTQRDTSDSASRDELDLPKPKPADDAAEGAADGDAAERTPRPSMALQSTQAEQLLDYFGDLSALGKVSGAHRRIIAGEGKASDANQIDWSLGGENAKDERRAKAVEAVIRTDVARDLLSTADRELNGKGRYNAQYKNAVARGGFDSIDAFSHSILGEAQLSLEASKLLGVAGSAQLVAHTIQQRAVAEGKGALDLDKVQAALKQLTDEQEAAVSERGLARIRQASERAATAIKELSKSEQGESLYTTTMARSLASSKMQEAKRGLGMMIGGLEATSALKTALDRKAGEKIKVGGFTSPAAIKELAAKARVKVNDGDITRLGAGQYTLSLDPDRLTGLLRKPPPVNQAYRDKLAAIRSGEGLDDEIKANQSGPGMSDTLDRNQAKGKMALLAAGSHLLAFDPGVGKTHTAIAAFEQLRHDEPDKQHKALIVCPTNMLRSWQSTIASQGTGRKISVVGQSTADPTKDTGDATKKKGQLVDPDADYTIVSYESLKAYRGHMAKLAESGEYVPRTTVIADELQKAKNEDTANFAGVEDAVNLAVKHHGAGGPENPDGGAHFFGLTGTPIEKDVSDINTMRRLVRTAKGQDSPDTKTVRAESGKLGQDEHIARGDKIRQFRKGLDEDVFRLSAQDAGNGLRKPKRTEHKVTLDPEHQAEMQARVKSLNAQIAEYHATKDTGSPTAMPAFGGRAAMLDALYGREDSAIGRSVADEIEKSGSFEHKGGKYSLPDGSPDPDDHAGTYEHKHVVFGSNETSKALFGPQWRKGEKGGLHAELEKRGIKVFIGHGGMSSAKNDANYKAFIAHKGKAVFLTNDKNNAGISLQFGDNKGAFQHGATHMHHFTLPNNNAIIQQREARTLRKGAQAEVNYHTYNAGTPVEQGQREALDRELRTQDLAANSESQVAGADTLAHHLASRGIKPEKRRSDS